jgi:hypothetical protein
VALLCPTTVLAEQHYQTFRSRLSGFPINVGLLSRFVTKSRQTKRDIIPIHFEGENSKRFYRIASLQKKLGLKFNIAMLLLPDEMYRSTGRKYTITFGKPISIESLDASKTDSEWAQIIRNTVYEL